MSVKSVHISEWTLAVGAIGVLAALLALQFSSASVLYLRTAVRNLF